MKKKNEPKERYDGRNITHERLKREKKNKRKRCHHSCKEFLTNSKAMKKC